MSFLSKWTGDNAGAVHLNAPMDGTETHRITGERPYASNDSAQSLGDFSLPPGLTLYSVITAVPDQTGGLNGLKNCAAKTLASIDSPQLQIDPNGQLEILLAAERPVGYEGNFLDAQVTWDCKGFEGNLIKSEVRVASRVVIREIFFDWEKGRRLYLDIVRVGSEGLPPESISIDQRKQQLANTGTLVLTKFGSGVIRNISVWSPIAM